MIVYKYKNFEYRPEYDIEPDVQKIMHDVYVNGNYAFHIDKSPYEFVEEEEFIEICEKRLKNNRRLESKRNANFQRLKRLKR